MLVSASERWSKNHTTRKKRKEVNLYTWADSERETKERSVTLALSEDVSDGKAAHFEINLTVEQAQQLARELESLAKMEG
jgi:hypothetical protein